MLPPPPCRVLAPSDPILLRPLGCHGDRLTALFHVVDQRHVFATAVSVARYRVHELKHTYVISAQFKSLSVHNAHSRAQKPSLGSFGSGVPLGKTHSQRTYMCERRRAVSVAISIAILCCHGFVSLTCFLQETLPTCTILCPVTCKEYCSESLYETEHHKHTVSVEVTKHSCE